MITSPHNPKLKELRRLARRRDGRFVAEGEDLLAAAAPAGWPARARFVAAGSGLEGEEVEPAVLAGVSALGSGTRAIGVYEERWAAPLGPLCVALWGVGDPGNVGTVLRSALAFGAGSVALGPGLRRPVRPQGGAGVDGRDLRRPRRARGRRRRAARASGSRSSRAPASRCAGRPRATSRSSSAPSATGLPDDVVAACDRVAHIPIAIESLNAAMAATVALYELTRVQRR